MITIHYWIKCIDKEKDYVEKYLLCKINTFSLLDFKLIAVPMYVHVNIICVGTYQVDRKKL